MTARLHHGDCRTVLATMPDASIDAVVTDPPYELGFMGKRWDATGIAYDVAMWAEVLRVLKPGGHLLAFGGTRTYHRMACAIEDSGFEIRDSIHWLYGSGFPKSLDVSKAVDKQRYDREDIYKVTAWVRSARDVAGITNKDIDAAFGTNGMAGHWTSSKSQPAVPTLDQVPTLLDVLGVKADDLPDDIRRLLWDLNGKEGQPGGNWAKREVTGQYDQPAAAVIWRANNGFDADLKARERRDTPATDAAKQWAGWGTALKPAHEPIVVARKPLDGTVAANVLQHGTGAINVDACRVAGADTTTRHNSSSSSYMTGLIGQVQPIGQSYVTGSTLGRWPANVVLSHGATCGDQCAPGCPIAAIDQQAHGAARFFTHADLDPLADLPFAYVAKPSRSERNAGLDELPKHKTDIGDDRPSGGSWERRGREVGRTTANMHPTVKPLALMRWLVRLVTPPDGTVLDPFAGSGTTLAAAILEHRHAIGIELTADYLPIINGRITWAQQQAHHDRHRPHQETLDL